MLRQRLVVFVTVTLLAALAIAAAQGCEGPSRGMGEHFKRLPASAPQQDDER